jgi:hypothetical protein
MTTYTTTATATDSVTNTVTVSSVDNMVLGLPITFSGTTFGGITEGSTYYIGAIVYGYPTSSITLSSLPGGAVFALTTDTGTMTATWASGGQQMISTVPPGESLNTAFTKINTNFDQIWAAGPVGSNVRITENSIITLNTNGNLVLNPNGIGNVVANAHVVPDQTRIRSFGSPSQLWNNIYTQYVTVPGSITTNAMSAGNVSATGNIATTGYFVGDGSQLTGITAEANTGNITFSNVTISTRLANANIILKGNGTGNVNIASSASVTGNVTAGYYYGNGAYLTGVNTGNANAIVSGNSNVSIATAGGNVTVGVHGVSNVAVFTPDGISVYGNILGPVPASSRVFYVAKNGNDNADGGLNTPFLTIKHAMAAAAAVGGAVSVHVAPGSYTEANPVTIPPNTALMGDNLRNVTVIPQTPASDLFYVTSGCYVWGITIKNYTGKGFSFDPTTPTQNVFVSPYIQNLTSSTTTGTAVYIDGNNVSSISTKAMIVGFFTIINQGGMGIHLLNSGYSQLVNIYTIACDVGIKVESGAFCTLNGSDCSIGNYGLVADGIGPLQTSAVTSGYSLNGVFNLVNETNGQPHVNTVMKITGDPEYYTIDTIVPTGPTTSTVVIQQTYTGNLAPGTTVEFYTRSSIIASAHTFEYVGAGTNPATALPQYGGIPIEANEVVATNGAVVTFTSTDQKGNFKVGKGFVINQATGTITGDDFYKSLYAQMTPYILALNPAP